MTRNETAVPKNTIRNNITAMAVASPTRNSLEHRLDHARADRVQVGRNLLVFQQVNQLERLHSTDHQEDDRDRQHLPDERNRDRKKLPHRRRAVEVGGFVQVGRNILHRRQIQDHVKPANAPHADGNHRPVKVLIRKPGESFEIVQVQRDQRRVDRALRRVELRPEQRDRHRAE